MNSSEVEQNDLHIEECSMRNNRNVIHIGYNKDYDDATLSQGSADDIQPSLKTDVIYLTHDENLDLDVNSVEVNNVNTGNEQCIIIENEVVVARDDSKYKKISEATNVDNGIDKTVNEDNITSVIYVPGEDAGFINTDNAIHKNENLRNIDENDNNTENVGVIDNDSDKVSIIDGKNEKITLYKACKQGNYELVKEILSSSTTDVNMADAEGWSCLHESCIHNCQFTKIAELLLENGANPNIQDANGETPMHGAVLFHFTDNVKLLCNYNADFTICNNNGVSSLNIAEFAKDVEVLALFGQPFIERKVKRLLKNRGRRVIVRPRNLADINYIPSPLSSPSILKKRKRTNDDDNEEGYPSPKKSISFSKFDRYSPSSLYSS